MTVCIAATFQWNYGTDDAPEWGAAIVAASDRMQTAGDLEYEAPRRKICHIAEKVVIFVSGEIPIHSEAILKLIKHLLVSKETEVPKIAELYGGFISDYRLKQAETLYLSPIGLDRDSFITRQNEMSPTFISDITRQMQNHRVDAEAIVCGIDNIGTHILHVDCDGFCTYQNDRSFVSIGIGYHHANSWLMAEGYSDTWSMRQAIFAVYAAKKRGEAAPGVGKATDVHLITKMGVSLLIPDLFGRLEGSFQAYLAEHHQSVEAAIARLKIEAEASPADVSAPIGPEDEASAPAS